jgi:hypothetical protein
MQNIGGVNGIFGPQEKLSAGRKGRLDPLITLIPSLSVLQLGVFAFVSRENIPMRPPSGAVSGGWSEA